MRLITDCFRLLLRYPEEEAFEMIKDAGFDGVDFNLASKDAFFEDQMDRYRLGDDYIERAHKTRELLDKAGLVCVQAHAPYEMKYGEAFDETCFHYNEVVRSLEAAAILGAPHTAIHSIGTPTFDERMDYNVRYFSSLLTYCEKFNIKIAVETGHAKYNVNGVRKVWMHSGEAINEVALNVGSPYCRLLMDTGHSAGTGLGKTPEDLLKDIDGNLLVGLHIQDSDYMHDNHTTPYFQHLNWERIMKTLSDIGYKGDFCYEDVNLLGRFLPPELTKNILTYRAEVGKHLISIFNKYQAEKEN